ncbi:MAG: CBS domain-containing protein [Actinomycetota bacterium]
MATEHQRSDLSAVLVEEVMTAAVITVDTQHPVGRARELMLGLRIHGLPVTDDDGAVVGIVTAADLVEEWPFGEPVETVMSRHVQTIEAEATAQEAATRMLADRIHHLVVTRDGVPVGLASSLDLLEAFVTQEQRRAHDWLLAEPEPAREAGP